MSHGLRPLEEVYASRSGCFECMKWAGNHVRPIVAAILIITAVTASCLLYFNVVPFSVGAGAMGGAVVLSLLLFVNMNTKKQPPAEPSPTTPVLTFSNWMWDNGGRIKRHSDLVYEALGGFYTLPEGITTDSFMISYSRVARVTIRYREKGSTEVLQMELYADLAAQNPRWQCYGDTQFFHNRTIFVTPKRTADATTYRPLQKLNELAQGNHKKYKLSKSSDLG